MDIMYRLTHSPELCCVEGFVLRKREWVIRGIEGCFENSCPRPDECTLKLRTTRLSKCNGD